MDRRISRYGEDVPENVESKLINQYACGLIDSSKVDASDKHYKALLNIEKDNTVWENSDGTREYLSIEIVKFPFAISCEGKYYKRSGSTLHELNGFDLQNFFI